MAHFDLQAFNKLLDALGEMASGELKQVIDLLRQHAGVIASFAQSPAKLLDAAKDEAEDEMLNLISGHSGDWDPRELFNMFDKDKSGQIDIYEFNELLKYMGLHMSSEKLLEVYSKADTDHNKSIDVNEFTKSLKILKQMVANQALEDIGLSGWYLYFLLIGTILFLLALLFFIFIGIVAFSPINSFSGVINSLLPAGAGVGFHSSNSKDKNQMEKIEQQLESSVKQVIKTLKY